MKRSIIAAVVAALVIALAGPALATDPHTTTTNNTTNNVTNNQGGAGGSASAGAYSGSYSGAEVNNTNKVTNTNTNSQGQSQGQKQKQGQAQGQSQNNRQTIAPSQSVSVAGDEIPAQAPSVFLPGLAVAPETCMGSTTAGGSAGFGGTGFSIGFGTTWKSADCELRMFARSLQQLGQNGAALALLAQNENVAKALRAAGVPIPGDKVASSPAGVPVALAAPSPAREVQAAVAYSVEQARRANENAPGN